MRVGFYQFGPRHGQSDLNLGRVEIALRHAQADLVVLPEMCLTGYAFSSRRELAHYAEPVPDGPTCQRLANLCAELKLNVVLGLPETAGGRLFNSAVLVTCEGRIHAYRKAHLFLDEKDLFEPGDTGFPVFDLDGARIGMLICFDHFFPEAARALALKGAQIICHPSNLVLDYAQTTTTCRTIENRVFWVLANRTGVERVGERELRFVGRSQIVGPGGRLLYRAGAETEELPVIEINPAEALDKTTTTRNHLLNDRRTDLY